MATAPLRLLADADHQRAGGALGPPAGRRSRFDGDDLWWSESRPEEGGRNAVMRRTPDGTAAEVLAAAVERPHRRARVRRRRVVGARRRALVRRLGHPAPPPPGAGRRAEPLTPEPAVARGLRYADGSLHPDGSTLLCVQEEHHADGREATNTIVRLAAHEPSVPEVVVEGPDFVSDPRWRPDGGAYCWIEWDHPDMPWDATRLVVDEGGVRTVVAGGERAGVRSASPPGRPTARSGSSATARGFWSLYRWTAGRRRRGRWSTSASTSAIPQWVFGMSSLRLPRRRPRRPSRCQRGRARAPGRAGARLRSGHAPRRAAHARSTRCTANGDQLVYIGGQPHQGGARRLGRRRRRAPSRAVDRARAAARPRPRRRVVPAARRPISFPTGGGRHRPRALLPADQPGDDRARRREAAAARADPRRPDVGGPAAALGGPPVLDEPWLRRRRRQLPRLHRLRPRVPEPAPRAVGDRRRRGLRRRVRVPRRARATSTPIGCASGAARPVASPRWPRSPSTRCSPPAPATTAWPTSRRWPPRPTSSRAATSTAWSGPWPEARATYEERSPIFHTDQIDRPLAVFQGLEDEVVPPNQAEMIVAALRDKGVPVAYLAVRGRAARVPPGEEHPGRPRRRAQLLRAGARLRPARRRGHRADPRGAPARRPRVSVADTLHLLAGPLAFLLAAALPRRPPRAGRAVRGARRPHHDRAPGRRRRSGSLGTATVALVNLDAAVVLLTPLAIRIARRAGIPVLPFAASPALWRCWHRRSSPCPTSRRWWSCRPIRRCARSTWWPTSACRAWWRSSWAGSPSAAWLPPIGVGRRRSDRRRRRARCAATRPRWSSSRRGRLRRPAGDGSRAVAGCRRRRRRADRDGAEVPLAGGALVPRRRGPGGLAGRRAGGRAPRARRAAPRQRSPARRSPSAWWARWRPTW